MIAIGITKNRHSGGLLGLNLGWEWELRNYAKFAFYRNLRKTDRNADELSEKRCSGSMDPPPRIPPAYRNAAEVTVIPTLGLDLNFLEVVGLPVHCFPQLRSH